MKKTYIIPEIQIYDADAENLLAGSLGKKNQCEVSWPDEGGPTMGDPGDESGEGSLAKQGDFFCDNFEYDFDF